MRKKSLGFFGWLLEMLVLVGIAIGFALLIQAFIIKPYKIPSTSMVPTLTVGQRVLVDRIGMEFSSPDVGDIVVFSPPKGWGTQTCRGGRQESELCATPGKERDGSEDFIKRIVAKGGDRIKVIDGRVIRNGKKVDEPYITPCGTGEGCDFPEEITVPKGYYFMMGDNRAPNQSNDSRFWGPVPEDWIVGEAFLTIWPPNRIGFF